MHLPASRAGSPLFFIFKLLQISGGVVYVYWMMRGCHSLCVVGCFFFLLFFTFGFEILYPHIVGPLGRPHPYFVHKLNSGRSFMPYEWCRVATVFLKTTRTKLGEVFLCRIDVCAVYFPFFLFFLVGIFAFELEPWVFQQYALLLLFYSFLSKPSHMSAH